MIKQSQQDMVATEKTFVEMLQRGECSADDIDVYIDKWHDGYHGPLKLYEYLGMTKQQYERWLVDSKTLLTMFPQDISKGNALDICVAK